MPKSLSCLTSAWAAQISRGDRNFLILMNFVDQRRERWWADQANARTMCWLAWSNTLGYTSSPLQHNTPEKIWKKMCFLQMFGPGSNIVMSHMFRLAMRSHGSRLNRQSCSKNILFCNQQLVFGPILAVEFWSLCFCHSSAIDQRISESSFAFEAFGECSATLAKRLSGSCDRFLMLSLLGWVS